MTKGQKVLTMSKKKQANKIAGVKTVTHKQAEPINSRSIAALDELNAAIVAAEAADMKWDLKIVPSRTMPVAMQTIYAASVENGMVQARLTEMCDIPGFKMAFSSAPAHLLARDAA